MAQGASPAPNDAAAAAAEVRRIAALENCCTTLCLWEPGPARLMIRKAKGQERARRASTRRRGAEGGPLERTRSTGSRRSAPSRSTSPSELRAAEETAREVGEAVALDAKAREALDWWLEQVRMLHALVSGAAHFLPTNTREKLNKSVDELEARQREARERLAPRKKFGFKNRSKVAGRQAAAPAAAAAAGAGADGAARRRRLPARDAAPLDGRGRDMIGRGARRLRGLPRPRRRGARARRGRGGGGRLCAAEPRAVHRFAQVDVARAVDPRAAPTVVAVPVGGSIYVTDCEDCTLYLGARQLRVHTSARVDLYVHASSHPILEHCTALRFAPYPPLPAALAATAFAAASGLRADHNEWNHVEDFDWLKATHSPNWADEAERKAPVWGRL